MIQEKKTFQPVTSKDICQIYELLLADNFVSFQLNIDSIDKVDTIVANINAMYFGVATYLTPEEKAVAYLYFIIKNHPFIDGNKRTAVLTFRVVCSLNKLIIAPEISLDAWAVFIEKIQEQDHHLVIKNIANFLFDKVHKIS